MGSCLLGIDTGSGGCKVTILDIEKGCVETDSREYPTYYPKPGWSEQDPQDWTESAGLLIKKLLKKTFINRSEITGVGVSGVTHSPVLLDSKGAVIRRSIHLTDARSSREAFYLKKKAGRKILNACMNDVNVMWTAPMLLWLREHEPGVWESISKVIFPKDYVRYRLTGKIGTDNIDAEGTLLFNTFEKKWDDRFLRLIGLHENQLPEIHEPTAVCGEITGEGARWSGLQVGTPVVTGSTDTVLEVFSTGAKNRGDCTVKLATFGRICVLWDEPLFNEKLVTYSYLYPGMFYPGTGTKSFASSLRWFRDTLWEKENGREETRQEAYLAMERAAENVAPGADGLVFHPYLQGEGSPYNDPKLRGGFLGITLHHRREHFVRAVMEGTCFSLLDSMQFIEGENLSVKEPVCLIGGGTKNKLWTQVLVDVLGKDGIIPPVIDPSYGAALLAGIGTGVFSSLEDAQNIKAGKLERIHYNREKHEIYKHLFNIYKGAHDRMVPVYHGITDFFEDMRDVY